MACNLISPSRMTTDSHFQDPLESGLISASRIGRRRPGAKTRPWSLFRQRAKQLLDGPALAKEAKGRRTPWHRKGTKQMARSFPHDIHAYRPTKRQRVGAHRRSSSLPFQPLADAMLRTHVCHKARLYASKKVLVDLRACLASQSDHGSPLRFCRVIAVAIAGMES